MAVKKSNFSLTTKSTSTQSVNSIASTTKSASLQIPTGSQRLASSNPDLKTSNLNIPGSRCRAALSNLDLKTGESSQRDSKISAPSVGLRLGSYGSSLKSSLQNLRIPAKCSAYETRWTGAASASVPNAAFTIRPKAVEPAKKSMLTKK